MRRIDALVLIQRPECPELPAAIIAAARSAGKPVLVSLSPEPPAELTGVLMVDPSDVIATARHLLASPPERSKVKDGVELEPKRFLKRLGTLAGTARPTARKRTAPDRAKPSATARHR